MKAYKPDPNSDILTFRAQWRKCITWMLPSEDQLRRVMHQWCPRYDLQLKRALKMTAEKLQRSGTFEEIVNHTTAALPALWQADQKAMEEQRKVQLRAERMAKVAAEERKRVAAERRAKERAEQDAYEAKLQELLQNDAEAREAQRQKRAEEDTKRQRKEALAAAAAERAAREAAEREAARLRELLEKAERDKQLAEQDFVNFYIDSSAEELEEII